MTGTETNAPAALPIGALLAAAAALCAGAVTLLLDPTTLTGPVASPSLLALTHLFTLGFVTLVLLGTLQQLPSVMMTTTLAWPNLGTVSLPLTALGALTTIAGFARGIDATLLALGGTLVCCGVGLGLAQLLATAAKNPPRDPAGRGLVTAVTYLFLTILAGLLLAAARGAPSFAAAVGYSPALHQTIGLAGAFLLAIAAAGHKLLSMFVLAKGGSAWRLRCLTLAVHVALLATLARALAAQVLGSAQLDTLLGYLAVGAIAVASALQLWEVKAILGRRLRKRLDAPVVRFVLAHAFLPLAGALLLLGFAPAATAAFLLGFVGLAVSGMAVKILSFLTWTSVYTGRAARTSPPLLRTLMLPGLEPVTTIGLAVGALLAPFAILLGSGALALLTAICLTVGAGSQLLQAVFIVYKTLASAGVKEAKCLVRG